MFQLIKLLFVLCLGVISCACVNMVAIHELNTKASNYLQEGDIQAAISRLEASVDLDGNIYESRYNLASAYLQVGRNEEALKNIEVALTLEKNEPIVFYTHGVAAMNVANELYEKKDKDGKITPVTFDTEELEKRAAVRYVELMTDSNKSFEKYTELAPNAEDTQQIFELIKENQAKIDQKMQQFDITLEE